MTRPPWLPTLLMFCSLAQQAFSCVDVLFVVDNSTLEVSKGRALQVARQLPEDQKIRKWVVLSRNDRYVPRVLRNNAELQAVLSTVHGDYDRFLEVATGEISRRTATFQPFVILLFSETPVNQTLTNMWRSMSLAPALHIFRIGSLKRTKMLSENQEIDFEHLIQCGRNQTNPFDGSSKFSGSHNEIRRAPTSTHRPFTSTRDPYVRRLTFYDASRTLLEEKEHKKENKDPTNKQFTITRTFKKMSTRPMSSTTTIRPTTRSSSNLNSKTVKFDSKRASREPTTNKWGTNVRATTIQPGPTEWSTTQVASSNRFTATTRRPYTTTARWFVPYSRRIAKIVQTTTRKPQTTTARWFVPYSRSATTTTRPPATLPSSVPITRNVASTPPTVRQRSTTVRWFVPFPGSGSFKTQATSTRKPTLSSTRPYWQSTTRPPPTSSTARWFVPYSPRSTTTTTTTTTRRPATLPSSIPVTRLRNFASTPPTVRQRSTTARWFVPFPGSNSLKTKNQVTSTSRPGTSSARPYWQQTTTRSPPPSTTARWFVPYSPRAVDQTPTMNGNNIISSTSTISTTTRKPPTTTAKWFVPFSQSSQRSNNQRPQMANRWSPTTTRQPVTTTPKTEIFEQRSLARQRPVAEIYTTTTRRPSTTTTTTTTTTTRSRPVVIDRSAKSDSSFWHPTGTFFPTTTPSPRPASTIELPPAEKLKQEMATAYIGKDFMVRSRSLLFSNTDEPPISSTIMLMKLLTTTRPTTTTTKAPVPRNCAADVFFLVDLSQGTGDKSQQYLDIAASAISTLPISQEAVRVGLISYSGHGQTHVRVFLDKHNDKEKLIEEMFLMQSHGGTTRTADAIRYAVKIFEAKAHPARKNVKKVLVVFTDGYSQDNPKESARAARANGLQVVAVAVKDRVAPPDEEQLLVIGGNLNNVLISPSGRQLRDKILEAQCRL